MNDPKQKYYDLGFTIKNPHTGEMPKLKEGYSFDEDPNLVNKICVSDANTHIERLVFPAWSIRTPAGRTILWHDLTHISGRWTMMTRGGDPSSVFPVEVYIRHIRRKYEVVK